METLGILDISRDLSKFNLNHGLKRSGSLTQSVKAHLNEEGTKLVMQGHAVNRLLKFQHWLDPVKPLHQCYLGQTVYRNLLGFVRFLSAFVPRLYLERSASESMGQGDACNLAKHLFGHDSCFSLAVWHACTPAACGRAISVATRAVATALAGYLLEAVLL